ncbi:MAG: DUF4129 domain-containing protein [Candidatus Roseilinea sp.]
MRDMSPPPKDDLMRERFVLSALTRHALAVLMVLCLALAFVDLAQRLMPALPVALLAGFSVAVSIEAMYAAHVLSRGSVYGRSAATYRFTEWVVILVSLKLALYVARGFDHLWFDLVAWQKDLTLFFMDGEYLAGIVLMLIVWSASTAFAGNLADLDADPDALEAERAAGVRTERASSRQRLAEQIFLMGGAIVVMMILAHVEFAPTLTGFGYPDPISAYAMIYFIAGLSLLAITQFTLLRAGWLWDRMPIAHGLGQRWMLYMAIFLGVLIALSLALPTGYSVGLLGVIGYLIALIAGLIQTLLFLLMQLIFVIGSLLASLFGAELPEAPRPMAPPPIEPPQLVPTEPGAPDPLWEILKSLIFWAIFITIVLYSLSQLLQLRQDWLAKLRQLPGLARLFRGWRWLWAQIRGAGRKLAAQVVETVRNLRMPTTAQQGRRPPGFVNVRRMSPRQQVVFFYLALLRRGSQQGYDRPASQTPYEYASRLTGALPEVSEDVSSMTAEFVEARYSAHEIAPARVSQVQRYWERIKAALRNTRRRS